MADDPDERQVFKVDEDRARPVGPGREPPPEGSFDPTRLDFGHYAGSTIEELATIDPGYLHWLERHPAGARYRTEIHRVLGRVPLSTDWNR